MKKNTLLFLSILLALNSCNGQNTYQGSDKDYSSIPIVMGTVGDTVSELDKSILIVFQDKHNNYWFGSDGQGVYRYDAHPNDSSGRGKTILHFSTKDGLCSNRIRGIQEDKSGNIFFNTVEGVSKFDGQAFTTLSITKNSNNEWKSEPDDLWFAGAQNSGVVYRYDGLSLHRLEFPKTKEGDDHFAKLPRSKLPNAKYSPYDVYTIYKDSKANVWFGTATLGVCRYDARMNDSSDRYRNGQGKSFTWLSEKELEFDESTGFGIRSILEDKDESFWFSNTKHRYHVYGKGNAFNFRKEKGIGSLDGKKDGDLVAIMSMVKGNAGEIWMVTYNAGVWRYDASQNDPVEGGINTTHFPVKDGSKYITLYSIYKDNNGDLWLGTHEAGAYKFNGKTFEKFRP